MEKVMTSGNPYKRILSFSLPLMAGYIFQQLYAVTDAVILGRTLGVHALAAVGSVIPVYGVLTGIGIGMLAGFAIVMSRFYGRGNKNILRRSFAMSAFLSLVLTFFLSAATLFFMPSIMDFLHMNPLLYEDASQYLSILSAGLFSAMAYHILSCTARALGDSRTPLKFLIFSSVLNIFLSLFFILILKLGVSGSAFATVLSQFSAALFCGKYIWKKYPFLHISWKDFHFSLPFALEHLSMGLPMAGQFILISAGLVIVQSLCNTFAPATIAGFTAASKIELLATQPMTALGVGMAIFAAQNQGAGKNSRIRKALIQCSILSMAYALLAGLLMVTFGSSFISFFTDYPDDVLTTQGTRYLHFSAPFYLLLGQLYIFRNTLQGLGIARISMISSILEFLARLTASFALVPLLGYRGICLASPLAWTLAALFTIFCFFHRIRRKSRTFSLPDHPEIRSDPSLFPIKKNPLSQEI